jgi:5'-3' exonuclease
VPASLLAVDAPSLLYRAHFALPDSIADDDGRPVNALLGFLNYVLRVVVDERPRVVVICSGEESAAYRVELLPAYHADRPPMPHELGRQFGLLGEVCDGFGWTLATSDQLEADDLLAAYARAEAAAGGSALVLTGDRDMYQLASDAITVLYVKTGSRGPERVDPAEVEARYGIPPALVPDFIALRGDPSDGIPGAKGIGEKTAADLLRRHGSLEAALANPEGERKAVWRTLRDQAGELREFLDIATVREPPVELPPDSHTDAERGGQVAAKLGMRRLAERLGAGEAGVGDER